MNDDTEHNAADAAAVDNSHRAPGKGRAELVFVPGKRPGAAERKKPPAAVAALPSALADSEPDARQLMLPSVPPPPPRAPVELPEPALVATTKRKPRALAAARTASIHIEGDDEFCAYAMRIGADRAYALLAQFFDPYLGEE